MRIRTDGKYSYREDTIDAIADFYGCNKTKALLLAAEQVPSLHECIEDIFDRDDLTPAQKRGIAQTVSKARGIEIEYGEEAKIERT